MADLEPANGTSKKRCFVVMGFGTKTDFATGRKLNLDYSYNALIKPVVESKGLECIRADEIRHSGAIDVPMYQELLTADVVVADLSTANVNAVYELGLRHAMRPRTTIVISEQQLSYPFDLSHIMITKYKTVGESIDYFEVLRFQKVLGELIDNVLEKDETDSPVYTFLNNLVPPSLQEQAQEMSRKVSDAIKMTSANNSDSFDLNQNQTLSLLVKQAEDALGKRNFDLAKSLFNSALEIIKCNSADSLPQNNAYLVQRLALATYKTQKPDVISALREAIDILNELDLYHTNDTETVALAGKIEKRLYFYGQGDEHLRNAITYFERAYYLLSNRYHGINLAFLINYRVNTGLYSTEEDRIADMMWANRYRREVLELCDRDLDELDKRKQLAVTDSLLITSADAQNTQQKLHNEEEFWIWINKAEAHFGIGELDEFRKAEATARSLQPTSWMLQGYEGQLADLKGLLNKYGHLVNPPWKE